jgi:hypothetical protein
MSSADSVSQNTQDAFGSYRIAFAAGQSIASTGNTAVTLPILGGGIGGGSYIIRRITVTNPANTAGGAVPSMTAANVSILTSNDGNASNAVASAQTLGNVSGSNTWQDLTLAAGAATTAYTANALYVKINTGVANSSLNFSVWGDVVSF